MSEIIVNLIYHLHVDWVFNCTVHWCLGTEECDAHTEYGDLSIAVQSTASCHHIFKCFVFNVRSTWGTVLSAQGYKWIVYYICCTYVLYVISKLVN